MSEDPLMPGRTPSGSGTRRRRRTGLVEGALAGTAPVPVLPPAAVDGPGGQTEAIPPRSQVPSTREQAAGVADYQFRPAPPPPVEPQTSWWSATRETLRQLDPRDIAAPGRRLPLIVLASLQTFGNYNDIAFGLLFVIVIATDMGFNFQTLFTVTSMVGVISLVAAPGMGFIADRFPRVWMVRVGALINNASTIVTGLAPGAAVLVGSRAVAGVGPAIAQPATMPLLADYFPPETRPRVFGFVHMVGQVFSIVSVSFIFYAVLIAGIGWRPLLVGVGILTTAVAFLTFLLREPVRGAVDRVAAGATSEQADQAQRPASWAEAWRTCSSIGTLRRLWYATPFTNVSMLGIGTLLFFALNQRMAVEPPTGIWANPRFSIAAPVLIAALPGVVGAMVTPWATRLASQLIKDRPARIMYYAGVIAAAQGLSLVGLLIIPNFTAAIVLAIVVGGAGGLMIPARQTLMAVVIPPRVRGQGMQSDAPWQLLGLLLMPIVGVLADQYGPEAGILLLVPVLLMGAAILMWSGVSVEEDMRAALAASMADQEAQRARAAGRNKMVICRDVDVTYSGTKVLFNVDLDIEEGELIALVGTNGAGKSTLLRAIAGLQEASNGAIFLDGEDITHKPAHLNARDGVVFLPGGRAIFPGLTVEENLRVAAYLEGDDEHPATSSDPVAAALAFFPELEPRLKERAGDLSGGEQQMVALAQSFVIQPRLLMIDELSLGLAPAVVDRLLDIVRGIHRRGTTVVLVEQSVNVALTIAQRAVFMDKGEIRFDGPIGQLLERRDLLRSVFFGSSDDGATGAPGRVAASGETVLELEDIAVAYGPVEVLREVSINLRAGEVVGVIGPNGAGKSTLFDVVSGFTTPDEGSIVLRGEDVTSTPPDARARRGLSRSFQQARLFPSLTVREALAVALEGTLDSRSAMLAAMWAPPVRRSERLAFRRVDALIERFNLGSISDKFIGELSTGNLRTVDLACVLATRPRVVLLDEPGAGLAQAEIELLGPTVRRLARDTGCGILVVEHDIPLLRSMADRVVALDLGRVISSGTPDEVFADPAVLRAYLNASPDVVERSGSTLTVAAEALGLRPPDRDHDDNGAPPRGPVTTP